MKHKGSASSLRRALDPTATAEGLGPVGLAGKQLSHGQIQSDDVPVGAALPEQIPDVEPWEKEVLF